jgi:hypothetical protein
MSLELGLTWLDVDYSAWHTVQLEAVLLNSIMPEESIPDAAIIDFLVAISVLPVAVFTTISVLGGAHDMPNWMRDQEEKIVNLNQDVLEEKNKQENEEEKIDPLDGFTPWKRTTNSDNDSTNEGESESDQGSRMIDLPFNLFDD